MGAGHKVLQTLLAQLGPESGVTSPVVVPEVKKESHGPGPLPYVVLGVGGAALVGGVVLAAVTVSGKTSLTYKDADTRTSIGFALGGVGLAGVAAGVIWAVLGSRGPSAGPVASVGIAPTAGGAAVCAGGTF